MTLPEPAAGPAGGPSPYLSLRRAVRPAIFAHSLLAAERDRAGELSAECEAFVGLTRDLLTAAGQARLLTPGPGREPPDGPAGAGGDQRARLLEAYAEAGMIWSQLVGSAVALGGTLLGRGDWDAVRGLAGFLHDAGEASAAAGLRARLGQAIWAAHHDRLRAISSAMGPGEIRDAIAALRTVLREVPAEFGDRDREVNRLLPPLAAAIGAVMKERGTPVPHTSRVEHIASGGVAKYPEIVTTSLDELAAEFEGLRG